MRHEGRHLAITRVGRRPRTVAIEVENQAAPVGGCPGANVHHRRVPQPSTEVEVDAARGSGRIACQLHERKRGACDVSLERREVGQGDDERGYRHPCGLRHNDEPGDAARERRDQEHRYRAHRPLHIGVHALQMGCHPEAPDAHGPRREQDAEGVVPGVHRGQVDDGEADPQARIAVAASLQIEARHRHEQDREVRLWQDAAEKRKRGVGDDVEQRAEDHRSQEDLAPELPLLVSLPVADYVTCCGSRHPDHRHDVVLAVENDPEHGDGKSREHECSRFDRLLYGRWREPQPAAQGSGHSVPTRSIDMSVSMTASPTTQPRRFLDLSTASNNSGFEAAVMTTTSISPPAGAVPAEGSFGYLASHSS